MNIKPVIAVLASLLATSYAFADVRYQVDARGNVNQVNTGVEERQHHGDDGAGSTDALRGIKVSQKANELIIKSDDNFRAGDRIGIKVSGASSISVL